MDELIRQLQRDNVRWQDEARTVAKAYESVNSVRQLAKLTGRSKSWIADSLKLARGILANPSIESASTRSSALKLISKNNKRDAFLRRLNIK